MYESEERHFKLSLNNKINYKVNKRFTLQVQVGQTTMGKLNYYFKTLM